MRTARRFWIVVLPGLLLLGGLVAGVALVPRWTGAAELQSGATDGSPTSTAIAASATVSRRDLVDRVSVDGTLAYGESHNVGTGKPGTLVAMADEGALVEQGQSLLTVDDRSLPLFYGSTPLWRTLSAGVADGPDVKQLEENLQALGFVDGLYFTIDEHFDSATQIAVQRWQKSLGREQTGRVEKGDLVFQPGPVRVSEHKAKVGDDAQPNGALMTVTGAVRVVTVKLDANRQSIAHDGDAVQIVLPDGSTVGGKITKVGTVAKADSSSDGNNDPNDNNDSSSNTDAKIEVTIGLDDPNAAGRLDQAPVTVKLTKQTASKALAVPVNSLLALREGGYAVEVERADGRRSLVGVSLGAFADGFVAIAGDVHEGDKVVTAK